MLTELGLEKESESRFYGRQLHFENKTKIQQVIRYSVTAITSRFHRGDRGSTPRIGVIFQNSKKRFLRFGTLFF